MSAVEVAEVVAKLGAGAAAAGYLGRVSWRGIVRTRQAWVQIEQTYDLVHHELQPNSGSSIKDQLNRIEAMKEREHANLWRAIAELGGKGVVGDGFVAEGAGSDCGCGPPDAGCCGNPGAGPG